MSASKRLLRSATRWLYFGHRWSGIVLCLFFALWFVSGVVMMYVPFPSFRAPERIAGAPPIDWARVRVAPADALATIGAQDFPSEMRLETSAGAPVYRMTTREGRRAVSAETGREIVAIDARQAQAIATAFVHAPAASTSPVDHDQWVVTRAYAKMAPFWRVRLADPAGTDLYVSQRTGEIVQNTTAHERFWNWLGAVPHWIYFKALRVHQEPWRQTVLWTSGVGLLGAIAGIWIGILRVRLSRRYRNGSVSPYRGWMKWHHLLGLIGGVFLVTWVFSGWLSMSPWGGLSDGDNAAIADRYSGNRSGFATINPAALSRVAPRAAEITFAYRGGTPILLARTSNITRTIDAATLRPLVPTIAQLLTLARAAMPGARLLSTERLDRFDLYWYTTGDPRSDARPLPILRLKFDNQIWLHVDPATGALLNQSGPGRRSYRWLFSALHSFDLPLLLEWRPLRDGLMWLLSAAGLAISVSGVVLGWRRLRRPRKIAPN